MVVQYVAIKYNDCHLVHKDVMYFFHTQAHLPEIKVHAYFAPVTPPPSVHGGGQRLCRCCIILWQWRARGGHLCLQVLLLWYGLKWGGLRTGVRLGGEEGLDPLAAPDHRSIHRLITADPWSVEPAPSLSSLAHRSGLQQPRDMAWRGGRKEHGWSLSLSLSLWLIFSLLLSLTLKTKTDSPLYSSRPWLPTCKGMKDCIRTAAAGGRESNLWSCNASCSN